MTKQRSFAGGAAVLAVFTLAAKILSAFYRIPLTNLLGAEGIGMYQLVFSIFALVLSLTTGGIPLAVSRLTAEKNALGGDNRAVLKSALSAVTLASVLISVILIFCGKYIAALQGNEAVRYGYALIAPSVVLVGALAMFRGWFQGNYNVLPTAISQLIEQAFKLIFGLLFAKLLLPRGIIFAVYGALLGVAVSEAAALIYVAGAYLVGRKKLPPPDASERFKDTSKALMKIGLSFAIAGFIIPFSQFIDGILIINLLKYAGQSTASATAGYGLFSGTVMSVVNLPVVLTLSLSVTLIPVVSASRVNRNLEGIILKSATSIKLSYVIGLPSALLMFVYANPIITLLYPSLSPSEAALAVNLFRITCFSVTFAAQREIYASLLMALDKTYASAKITFAAVILKTAVMTALLLTAGITGAAYGVLVLGVSATAMYIFSFNKLLGKNVKLVKNISTIIVSSAIMTLVALIVYYAVPSGSAALIAGGLLSAIVYLLCLMLFKVFDAGELQGIPFSRYLDKLTVKIRFWENKKQ